MHRRGKCGMVIIDYLQLLDTSTRNPNSTREREIAAASRAAKLLAKELNIPVIMLSQLSRKVEERAGNREPSSKTQIWSRLLIVRRCMVRK